MKLHKILIALTSAACLTLVLAPAAQAGEGCQDADELQETCKLIEQWAKRTIGNASFVATCMGFAEDPELCDAGDTAGSGLVCPPAEEPATTSTLR